MRLSLAQSSSLLGVLYHLFELGQEQLSGMVALALAVSPRYWRVSTTVSGANASLAEDLVPFATYCQAANQTCSSSCGHKELFGSSAKWLRGDHSRESQLSVMVSDCKKSMSFRPGPGENRTHTVFTESLNNGWHQNISYLIVKASLLNLPLGRCCTRLPGVA